MKHLIIGIDGTWRAAFDDSFHSNVFRLSLAMEHRDKAGNPQIFIYSGGLGTNGVASRYTGALLADGLDENILQAYINICSNYEPGDKIYLFGFSRGAVAARALCGFITTCGLLRADASWLVKTFWKQFAGVATEAEDAQFQELKPQKTYPDVKVEFLGAFDTVCGPYGRQEILRRLRFKTLRLDRIVKHGVHIVSIDDTRLYFRPVLWEGVSEPGQQTIEQIWLPGVHSDVGGGYRYTFFSTLSLVLMLDKFAEVCPDLKLNEDYISSHTLRLLKEQDIVINDERAYKLSSYLFQPIPRALELAKGDGTMNDAGSLYTQHPFTEMIRNKRFRIRRAIMPYVPTLRLNPDRQQLRTTEFGPDSWHTRQVLDILANKALRLH
jgi:hypothetical protein